MDRQIKKPVVGVLALQGDFAKHMAMLKSLGAGAAEIRKPAELDRCDALIIPGGESTAILRQMNFIGLTELIRDFAKKKPLFGTCAGLILMSREIVGDQMTPFGLLDVVIERNAFGRQTESFETNVEVSLPHTKATTSRAVFIRAPRIRKLNQQVQVLAQFNEEPILVQEGFHLGATFHPELTDDPTIHRYFLSLIEH